MRTITIELFGALRLKAGQPCWRVEAQDLGEALARLVDQAPELRGILSETSASALHPAYRACINGRQFASDPRASLSDGDVVLLIAADAGG